MGWGLNKYNLVRIPVKKVCKIYYLRWYYNGWHYWAFLPGRVLMVTEGEEYRTIGTKKISMGSGQITRAQCTAIRTIMNTREVALLTIAGWMNIRIEPGTVNIYDNQINGNEIEFVAVVGSKDISYSDGYSPVGYIPETVSSTTYCELIIGDQIWMCYNYASNYPGSKVYNNDEVNRALYGGLYTFAQINSPGFCPVGWHVPTLTEWQKLINFVGGDTLAGGILKETLFTYWNAPNTGAVDSYGFKARGSGYYNIMAGFMGLKYYTKLWTATELYSGTGENILMAYNSAAIVITSEDHQHYCPVRLIKDSSPFPLLDKDNNVYTTVKIGTQEWIVENLKVTQYSNGVPIPNLTLDLAWAADLVGAYCWFNNDIGYKNPYGAIYNWYVTSNVNNIAYLERNGIQEIGWHVPTNIEFNTLIAYLGGGLVAGGKLKEMGLIHWTAPNTGATNEYGFTGIGAADRSWDGSWGGLGAVGNFWASTDDGFGGDLMQLGFNTALAQVLNGNYNYGLSIRLVRDV